MTPFEIIILAVIYFVCYGYMTAIFLKKEDNVGLMILLSIVSLILAIYAPIIFGGMLYEKMKNEQFI